MVAVGFSWFFWGGWWLFIVDFFDLLLCYSFLLAFAQNILVQLNFLLNECT